MIFIEHSEEQNRPSSEIREAVSQQLSEVYVRLDECWLTGADPVGLQQAIDAIERQYSALLTPCHLCDRPTIFRDAAYELPFCWRCLHEKYDFWYRSVRYNRNGNPK